MRKISMYLNFQRQNSLEFWNVSSVVFPNSREQNSGGFEKFYQRSSQRQTAPAPREILKNSLDSIFR